METEPVLSPRPSVFLASSSEGLPVAEAVRRHLEPDAEVDIWTDNVFRLNRGYLHTLLDRSGFYDYAVVVMTPDDALVVRGEVGRGARDNVVFEYGLFLGRLGPRRAFVFKERSVRTFTDFAGIEVATFVAGGDLDEATRAGSARILEVIRGHEQRREIGFLPSTALALGYYHNFLGRLIEAFLDGNELCVVEGEKERAIAYDERDVHISVLLPRALRDLEEASLKSRTRRLRQVTLKTRFRNFPFFVEGALDRDAIELFDIPTTLRASLLAIREAFSPDFQRDAEAMERVERREIRNFETTLRKAIPDHLEGLVISIRPLDSF